ncbi:tRNA 2-selenouridine(34) synthase MnmH [Telluribacter sp. SYSU D00476]|uniref:tRNA 2-selenouridine(34) synthase MnmH n=1 Tax=Telluribacter sp. SYSU D00476 TaxID=2811430 RepID=UPI001FF6957B|nr:tRNA 2-selenouridine(34) synthase MnmH [Telluribacter sp. SYSU D00476]
MPQALSPQEFLKKAATLPVVDVRSPGEFAQAHIPGAVNIPLFTNEERAVVGTAYKQISKDDALLRGLEYVGPKMADFVRQSRALAPDGEILVHCWRGGMRSGSFAWLLETAGMRVSTLVGGYKAYRNLVLDGFTQPRQLVILGGKTGSGKTEILKELHKLGEQVLDLEALAHHKGSSYGAIGQAPQPTSEQYENDIAVQWQQLDPERRIWVEDESRTVGRCFVPLSLWEQMCQAPVAFVDVPKEVRIQRLVREYACYDHSLLYEATDRIRKRLGGQHHQAALAALEQHDYATVADITLTYYDKAYLHGLSFRTADTIFKIDISEDNPVQTAQQLVAWAEKLHTTVA